MKKLIGLGLFVFLATGIPFCQTPDDALRSSLARPIGTGRTMGFAGAFGALGGDITAAHANPAGIGAYKTNELALGYADRSSNGHFGYRGTDSAFKERTGNIGCIGAVFSFPEKRPTGNYMGGAFAVSLTNTANFNGHIAYKGLNNQSSFSEQYLEELQADGADTLSALDNYIFGSSLAFRTYLIDTVRATDGSVAGYQSLVPVRTGTMQRYAATRTGGMHELAFTIGINQSDRHYFGGGLCIAFMNYGQNLTYSETDATKDTTNRFAGFTYKEDFSSQGSGIGINLGYLFKATPGLRLGLSFQSPRSLGITDKINSSMTTNTESYARTKSESSANLNNGLPGKREYILRTAYKATASAAYILGSNHDVTKQRGFVSTDVELVNYRSARFAGKENVDPTTLNYLDAENQTIKKYYRPAFNIRLGGELKYSPLAVRAGWAVYGSPYQNAETDGSSSMVTIGLGYRGNGIFIDLALQRTYSKDVHFPYRLSGNANTFATQTATIDRVCLGFGFKW